jgi:hypothetical protein
VDQTLKGIQSSDNQKRYNPKIKTTWKKTFNENPKDQNK